MAAFLKYDIVSSLFISGFFNANSDVFKLLLSNRAPDLDNDQVRGNVAEIAAGNGYPAGGIQTTISISRPPLSNVVTYSGTAVTFTASGGPIGPFRAAILYDETTASDYLVAAWDNVSSITLQSGDSLVVTFGGSNPGPIFSIQ